MKLRTEDKDLAVNLTDDEIRERGERLAELHGVLDKIAEDEAEFKAEIKRRKKPVKLEVDTLARAIRNRRELRNVAVDVHYDPARGMVDEIRTDTGEVIATRRPTKAERQGQLISIVPNAEVR